jgi:hypothetical protein
MTRAISRRKVVLFSILAASLAAAAAAQTDGEAWVTLLDGADTTGWTEVGETNWHEEDGAIVADNRTSEAPAYLVTEDSYGDFELVVEFWSSDDANSGVFFRCADPEQITDTSCYEANIFDERPDPSYGTGAIVRHAEVDPMPRAGGEWSTFEITALGRDITVRMNGETTATLRSGLFEEGPIALQHGSGTIKFRRVAIRPLDEDA